MSSYEDYDYVKMKGDKSLESHLIRLYSNKSDALVNNDNLSVFTTYTNQGKIRYMATANYNTASGNSSYTVLAGAIDANKNPRALLPCRQVNKIAVQVGTYTGNTTIDATEASTGTGTHIPNLFLNGGYVELYGAKGNTGSAGSSGTPGSGGAGGSGGSGIEATCMDEGGTSTSAAAYGGGGGGGGGGSGYTDTHSSVYNASTGTYDTTHFYKSGNPGSGGAGGNGNKVTLNIPEKSQSLIIKVSGSGSTGSSGSKGNTSYDSRSNSVYTYNGGTGGAGGASQNGSGTKGSGESASGATGGKGGSGASVSGTSSTESSCKAILYIYI